MFKVVALFVSLLVFHSLFLNVPKAQNSTLAFPSADGFGKYTKGARGNPSVAPQILKVTNLEDSGTGSLRWALTRPFPRFVVFDVTGIIELESHITVSNPYITIAGQTAPGKGITIKNYGIKVNTSEVIMRGLKFRTGDQGLPANDLRGLSISTTGASGDVSNVIVDHVSATWGVDTNLNLWRDITSNLKISDVTIQWSIFAEALYDSIHIDEINGPEAHSMGATLGRGLDAENVSFHHNLMASNNDRNPRIAGINRVEVVNNLIYGWGPSFIGGGGLKFSSDYTQAHVINNYFKTNPHSRRRPSGQTGAEYSKPFELELGSTMDTTSRVFYKSPTYDNVLDDFNSSTLQEIRIGELNYTILASSPRFSSLMSERQSATQAAELVLSKAGALPRDEVDSRIVENVIARNGEIIDSQDQVGGWPIHPSVSSPEDSDNDGIPNTWENQHPPLDSGEFDSLGDFDGDGYLNIEEYINSFYDVPITPTTPQPIPGDTNGDERVDGVDYVIWLINYSHVAVPGDCSVGNFNNDSVVDGMDYVIWLNNYSN